MTMVPGSTSRFGPTRVTQPPSISTSAEPSTPLTGSTTRPPLRIVLSGFDTCVPTGSHADKFGLARVAVLLKKSEVRRQEKAIIFVGWFYSPGGSLPRTWR